MNRLMNTIYFNTASSHPQTCTNMMRQYFGYTIINIMHSNTHWGCNKLGTWYAWYLMFAM